MFSLRETWNDRSVEFVSALTSNEFYVQCSLFLLLIGFSYFKQQTKAKNESAL